MSVLLAAPYDKQKIVTVLPNPEFGDAQATQGQIQLKRKMNGDILTYAKPNDKQVLSFTWLLTRMKHLELREFTNIYHSADWQITDHNGTVWKAQLTGQPVIGSGRLRYNEITGSTGHEEYEVTMTFSAEKIT